MADSQPTTIVENWKPVVGYEGRYEVSDLGRVRSLDRKVSHRNRWGMHSRLIKGKTLTPKHDKDGYCLVSLGSSGAPRRNRFVHHLVLGAFSDSPRDGRQCRHLDGDKRNNRIHNLAWGTSLENSADRRLHGVDRRGESHPNAKITEQVATQILQAARAGETHRVIAERFGVSRPTVFSIASGRTWAHLQPDSTEAANRRREYMRGYRAPAAEYERLTRKAAKRGGRGK